MKFEAETFNKAQSQLRMKFSWCDPKKNPGFLVIIINKGKVGTGRL